VIAAFSNLEGSPAAPRPALRFPGAQVSVPAGVNKQNTRRELFYLIENKG
jgi:hypothetical protein